MTYTWHIPGTLESWDKSERFLIRAEVEPVEVRLTLGVAPAGAPLRVDILADGVSIFGHGVPQLDPDTKTCTRRTFGTTATSVAAGATLSLAIVDQGNNYSGEDLTVELDVA